MKKYLLIVLTLFGLIPAWAHNAKIATYTLRNTGAGWIVEINFAQAGLLASLERELGRETLASLDVEDLKAHIIDRVQRDFLLEVDGTKVRLENGGILMGSHQTNFKFALPEIPAHPRQMHVYIPMCGETYNHTNIFRIYQGGNHLSKVFLSEDNNFQAELKWTNGSLHVVADTAEVSAGFGIIEGSLVMMLVSFLFFGLFRLVRLYKRELSI